MSSSLSSVRESLARKLDNWVKPFREERDERCRNCKDNYPSLQKLKELCPHEDENILRVRREKTLSDCIKRYSWTVERMNEDIAEIFRHFDDQYTSAPLYFQVMAGGEPIDSIPTVDPFEELGEAQCISYEAYCKAHDNVEEEENPKYFLACLKLLQREVPESIVCLRYLREFTQERLLDRLPPNFGQLYNLRRIDIGEYTCGLAELPEDLGTFPHLKVLRIVNTQIKRIPPSLFENTSIEEMILEHNQIEEIDSRIGNLCNLRVFNVNYNQIASLPDSLGDLQRIEEFRISYNKVTTLPPSIDNLNIKIIVEFAYNNINQMLSLKHPKFLRVNKYIGNPVYEELKSQEKVSENMSKLELKEHK